MLQHIGKSFPGVRALHDITLAIMPGEIHALCGENGAGKSTLMNIVTGNLQPDAGTMLLNGVAFRPANARQALQQGIAMVHQHLSLVDTLSVAENIFANRQPVGSWGLISYRLLYDRTRLLLHSLGIDIDPRIAVSLLSPAQKQMVEIAKALSASPQVLILDEPTASLTPPEIQVLFKLLRERRKEGVAIIYISHRLPEIDVLADRITVLKDGQFQGTFAVGTLSKEQLIQQMVGRDLLPLENVSFTQDTQLLAAHDMAGPGFRGVSFQLHAGEIIGFAGLAGAGRTEMALAVFGDAPLQQGAISTHGNKVKIRDTKDAVQHRLAYVPEDRKRLGLFPAMSVAENMLVAARESTAKTVGESGRDEALVDDWIRQLNIRTPHARQPIRLLSGGNQQKVLLARWLATDPRVLIVDEPTHGVDVGAKTEIYRILKDLAKAGLGIIVISSEFPELLALCDRIIVLRQGTMAGEVDARRTTEEELLTLATG